MTKHNVQFHQMHKAPELLSPAEMEKVVRALNKGMKVKEAAAIVNPLADRSNIGYKLVHESAPGEAIANTAENDFKALAKPKKRKSKK